MGSTVLHTGSRVHRFNGMRRGQIWAFLLVAAMKISPVCLHMNLFVRGVACGPAVAVHGSRMGRLSCLLQSERWIEGHSSFFLAVRTA